MSAWSWDYVFVGEFFHEILDIPLEEIDLGKEGNKEAKSMSSLQTAPHLVGMNLV
jgi:hypothetical protein